MMPDPSEAPDNPYPVPGEHGALRPGDPGYSDRLALRAAWDEGYAAGLAASGATDHLTAQDIPGIGRVISGHVPSGATEEPSDYYGDDVWAPPRSTDETPTMKALSDFVDGIRADRAADEVRASGARPAEPGGAS